VEVGEPARCPDAGRWRSGFGAAGNFQGAGQAFPGFAATTPEDLAGALGLSAVAAKEWQVQHALLKRLKEIVRQQAITHAEIARRAGTARTRVTAILNDDLEHVSTDLLIRILGSLGYRVRVSVVRSDNAA
jgi:predicted XRE-type DNA-binding protein